MFDLTRIKAKAVNRVQATDFQSLETDYNLLCVEYDKTKKELDELKGILHDSMGSLFLSETEVKITQRIYYILIGMCVAIFIILITVLFK